MSRGASSFSCCQISCHPALSFLHTGDAPSACCPVAFFRLSKSYRLTSTVASAQSPVVTRNECHDIPNYSGCKLDESGVRIVEIGGTRTVNTRRGHPQERSLYYSMDKVFLLCLAYYISLLTFVRSPQSAIRVLR